MLGRDGVLDLVRLGRDLRDTKDLSGIKRIRHDLRFLDQYPGCVFEYWRSSPSSLVLVFIPS